MALSALVQSEIWSTGGTTFGILYLKIYIIDFSLGALLKTDRTNRIVACEIGFLFAPQILSAHGLSAALNFCIYYIRTSTKDPVF
jgi:hypothetical protein